MQEIRVKRGWSYGASSRVGFDRQRDAFSMWTTPKDTDAAACLALELEMLHAFREEGVTEDELTLVKRYLVRSHAFDVDTARKRVHQKLEAEIYDLPSSYHDRYVDHVLGVDHAAANAAAKARISEDNLVIAVVGTHAEIGEAVAKAIPCLDSVTVAPFDLE
jgi:zinc protease